MNITSTTLMSNDILQELVFQSLTHIIGTPHTVITRDLPFSGNHMLVLDQHQQPALISYDLRDGGRALLAGLAALDGLMENRSWLYRLYPALFDGGDANRSALRIEDIGLIVLAPQAPPGHRYLATTLPKLTIFTFQPLQSNDDFGLLIDALHQDNRQELLTSANSEINPPAFRRSLSELNREEEDFFHALRL